MTPSMSCWRARRPGLKTVPGSGEWPTATSRLPACAIPAGRDETARPPRAYGRVGSKWMPWAWRTVQSTVHLVAAAGLPMSEPWAHLPRTACASSTTPVDPAK